MSEHVCRATLKTLPFHRMPPSVGAATPQASAISPIRTRRDNTPKWGLKEKKNIYSGKSKAQVFPLFLQTHLHRIWKCCFVTRAYKPPPTPTPPSLPRPPLPLDPSSSSFCEPPPILFGSLDGHKIFPSTLYLHRKKGRTSYVTDSSSMGVALAWNLHRTRSMHALSVTH